MIARSSARFIVLGASLLLATPASAQLVRQPYLQRTSTVETTVAWTTLFSSSGEVHYGTTLGSLTEIVESDEPGTSHQVRITDLTADTRYYYEIFSNSASIVGGDAEHYFETNPAVGSQGKFRAWVLGDSGTGLLNQAWVRDAMIAEVGPDLPDLFLHVGDMAYGNGTDLEFTFNFYAPYADILRHTTVWPTLGNHESHSSESDTQSGPYYAGYVLPAAGEAGGVASGTEAYYSFDYANAHMIVLDSADSPREPEGAMLTWLAADLAATTQEWIVAFWHHPPYSKGSHDSDDESQLVDMRENALPILEAGGVDLVLTGHSHNYERSYLVSEAWDTPTTTAGVIDFGDGRPDGEGPYVKDPADPTVGTVHVVAGHGGRPVDGDGGHPVIAFSEIEHGSVILDFQANRLNITNIRIDGEITDDAGLVKGDAIVVLSPDGGQAMASGMPWDIQWLTIGTAEAVDLDWSCDNGETWLAIDSGVTNVGSYEWTVPAVEAERAVVRVTAADDPTMSDESNASFVVSQVGFDEVIGWGSIWLYEDSGTDLGEEWLAADYDDTSWGAGPGQLGFGDGDEATELVDDEPNQPSVYFRSTFSFSGAAVSASLDMLYDDGVAVWINGTLVTTRNMILGTEYSLWASGFGVNDELSTEAVDGSLFVTGENTIAAMVKQVSDDSDDLSFDLRLVVEVEGPETVACADAPTGDDDDSASGDDDDSAPPVDDDDATDPPDDDDVTVDDDDATAGDDDDSGASGAEGCDCESSLAGAAPAAVWALLPMLAVVRRRRS